MTRLGNSRIEEGSDPDIFFRKIDQLCEELEVVNEHVLQHRMLEYYNVQSSVVLL